MSKVNDIVESIVGLTIKELAELFEVLKEKFGVADNMLQFGGAAPAASTGGSEAAAVIDPNKKVSLVLSSLGGESKLSFIKAMKEALGTSITEASTKFAEASAGNATILQSDLARKDAEEIVAKLKAHMASATIDIK